VCYYVWVLAKINRKYQTMALNVYERHVYERPTDPQAEARLLPSTIVHEVEGEQLDRKLSPAEREIVSDWMEEAVKGPDAAALRALKRDRSLTAEDQRIIAEWQAEQDHRARGGVVVNAALGMAMSPEDAERVSNSESGERPKDRY
jgi:hypothetical protein